MQGFPCSRLVTWDIWPALDQMDVTPQGAWRRRPANRGGAGCQLRPRAGKPALTCRPLASQLRRKPLCTQGRVP